MRLLSDPLRAVLRLLALTGLSALAACSTPPPPARALSPTPAAWQSSLPHGGDVATLDQWWRRFDDPLPAELVALAQASHPSMAQAVARIAQSRAGLQVAQSGQWPTVIASAQASRGANATSLFESVGQGSVAAHAAWEVDLFGGLSAEVASAQARQTQANLEWHAARVSLAAEVAQAYVTLRWCEALRNVLDEDAASQQQSAQLTREKVRVGFESPANGALADGVAADAASRALAQRALCEAQVQTLVLLSGEPTAALRTRLAPRTGQLPTPAQFVVTTLPAQLLAQRPDIAAAEQELLAAAADIDVAEAARYPRLVFNGNLGLDGLRVGGVTLDGRSWSFGPTLSLPLFDAGRRAAQADGARARYDEVAAILDGRLSVAINEVEDALVRLDAASRRETQLQTAAQGFRAYYAAAEQRWRIGSSSLFEREEARRIALNAHNALLAVQRERVQAWVALYRALGGGWSPADAAPEMNKK